MPLRVDYDFLLVTLGIIYWGGLLRITNKQPEFDHPWLKSGWVVTTALVAGIGVWTSISFMLILLIGLFYLFWIFNTKALSAYKINLFLVTLCIAFSLEIMMEHPNFSTIAYDVISLVYLIFLLLILVFFNLYSRLNLIGFNERISTVLLFGVLIFFIMNHLFPGFYFGPYNQVDPYLLKNFFPMVSEFYSPFAIDPAIGLASIIYTLIGGLFFVNHYLNKPINPAKLFLLGSLFTTTLLAIYMYRWVAFSIPLSILVVSFFIAQCGKTTRSKAPKILILVFFIFLPKFLILLTKDYLPPAQELCQTELYSMLKNGYLESSSFKKDKIILAHSNYGPLLLYSTHFSIIGTNDHHNVDGLKDSFSFFKEDRDIAERIVKKRGIDLVLFCSTGLPRFNPDETSWLIPIPLPKEYSQWHLYRIRKFISENKPFGYPA